MGLTKKYFYVQTMNIYFLMKFTLIIKTKDKVMSNTELDIKESKNKNEVIVTDIQMPFGSMIVFMIKWVLASIPAMIILFLIFFSFIPISFESSDCVMLPFSIIRLIILI